MAAAASLVALLALTSRLLPGFITVIDEGGNRLSWPLIYFNATGLITATGIVLLLWASRRGSHTAVRWAAFGLLPATLLTLYLTLSRGGVLAALIGVAILLALSRNRLLYGASLAIALICTAPVIFAVQDRQDLQDGVRNQAAQGQGLVVLGFLLLATAVALAGFWMLEQIRRDAGRGSRRVLAISRDRRVLGGIAAVLGIAAIVLVALVGGRAWDRFSDNEITDSITSSSRLTQLSGTGRSEFWRVAIDGFGDEPVLGNGAGTFQYTWREHRTIGLDVRDAHSLYLETFDELGLLGGLMILGFVVSLLFWGLKAWWNAEEEERERSAALLAILGACAIVFGIDWFWEMPAAGSILFLAGGVLINVRCAQLPSPVRSDANGHQPAGGGLRYALGATVLAIGWISIASLVAPLWTQHELNQSQDAAAEGDFAKAIDRAQTARKIEPWASSPYVQLALLAQVQADYPSAITLMNQAIDREDENWQLYKLRSDIETQAGDTAAAEIDLNRAMKLNPLAFEAVPAETTGE